MKRLGIGTLIPLGMLLICERAAFANFIDNSATFEDAIYKIDDRNPIKQFLPDINGFRSVVDMGRRMINDPILSPGANDHGIDADDQFAGYFFDGIGADGFLDATGIYDSNNGPRSSFNWLFTIGIYDRRLADEFFDDAKGRNGLLDSGGTFVTLSDPRRGGGTITIGINSIGQIVGIVYDRTGDRRFPEPRIADVGEPNSLPFLAGCLPVLAMVFLRKRRKRRAARRRR